MTEPHRRTAIHEAGHAVIGRVLGLLCGHVTITPDHDSGGHSIIGDAQEVVQLWETTGKFREHVSAWRGRIMAMQAGAEAELEILGACCDGDGDGDGDGDDRHQISLMVELFDELNGKDDALRRHTRRLVRRHRTTIEIVANALLRRECLPANRIDELVWPSTMTRQHFVSFRQLRLRFGITVTRENVTLAMRVGSFPRGYLFNGRTLWRVGDVQNFVKDLH